MASTRSSPCGTALRPRPTRPRPTLQPQRRPRARPSAVVSAATTATTSSRRKTCAPLSRSKLSKLVELTSRTLPSPPSRSPIRRPPPKVAQRPHPRPDVHRHAPWYRRHRERHRRRAHGLGLAASSRVRPPLALSRPWAYTDSRPAGLAHRPTSPYRPTTHLRLKSPPRRLASSRTRSEGTSPASTTSGSRARRTTAAPVAQTRCVGFPSPLAEPVSAHPRSRES